MLIFCCHKKGWGWSNFIKEADTGNGLKFPKVLKFYLKWILPIIIIFIFVKGYIDIFSKI
jgi:NSS family neurotransmitter:Na+ symporter